MKEEVCILVEDFQDYQKRPVGMKLFIKISLFVFVAFFTISAAIVTFPHILQGTTTLSFYGETPKTIAEVVENDLTNCCQNGRDSLDYRVIDAAGIAAKGVEKGTYLVYEGLDTAGNVKYIGITGRDAAVRFGEHLNSGTARSLLDYRVIDGATGLSKIQAKIWEQKLINQYGLGKNGGQLLNKVNSIGPKNWRKFGIK